MAPLPDSIRYVKNGAGGRWWATAKDRSQIHAGWSNVPESMIRAGNLAGIDATIRSSYGGKQGATQDINAIRALLESPSQHIWVTFEDGDLWWALARDGVTTSPEGETPHQGHFWLGLEQPWNNRSLAGRHLAMSELPGIVTATASFKGTVCKPKGWREILRLVRDEHDADAAEALTARLAYQAAVGRLIARLRPRDFELLVDLVLARSGWIRVAKLGGTTEGIDIEVENPALGEIAFVQVKSSAGQGMLDDYIDRFEARRERYDRMIFTVHSPTTSLQVPNNEPVQIWDRSRLAELAVRLGLGDWIMKRT